MAFFRYFVRQSMRSLPPVATGTPYPRNVVRQLSRIEQNRSEQNKSFKFEYKGLNQEMRDEIKLQWQNKEYLTSDEWIKIRKDLLGIPGVTEVGVDMEIARIFSAISDIDKLVSFLEFLWLVDGNMKISAMAKYFSLMWYIKPNEKQKKYILDMYNQIRKQYSILDGGTAADCVFGITRTSRWKESFELVDMIKLTSEPAARVHLAIIRAGFDNDEPEISWEHFQQIPQNFLEFDPAVEAYLNYCKRNFEGVQFQEELTKIFQFGADNYQLYFSDSALRQYSKALEEHGWVVNSTTVSNLGRCQSCSHTMLSLHLSNEKLASLRAAIHKEVIAGPDIYRKSSPQEFKKFSIFLKNINYDIVIDGLNLSFLLKGRRRTPDGRELIKVVQSCAKVGKRVLILGRDHMKKWRNLDTRFIEKHGYIFYLSNLTNDDSYLLYAALSKGPNVKFISGDMMRQHQYLLNPEIKTTYYYWQLSHQIHLKSRTTNSTEVELTDGVTYLPLPQKDDDGWHVPSLDHLDSHESVLPLPITWYCLRNSKTKRSADPKTKTKTSLE